MLVIEQILLAIGTLLLVAVFASKASGRLGLPALLLFLIIGILAGSEGIGGIAFDDAGIAQTLGIVALAFILFAGGLDTSWSSVRPVLGRGLALSTVAVLITAVTVGLTAAWLLDMPILSGLLLGSIVSSTDAAAVFSVMRSRGTSLQERTKRVLELESGSNDPMAIFLTTSCIALILNPGTTPLSMVPAFFVQMLVGTAIGLGVGWIMVWLINRIDLGYDGLYLVLTLSVVVVAYPLANLLGGNGFLAVYLAGLMMGNRPFIHKRSIVRFHDGLGWLMQITMFVTLGLLVFPSQLVQVIVPGLVLSLVLIFVARPLGVVVTMLPFRVPPREIGIVSWVGLRGAVPIVLATYPLVANVPNAVLIFNVVFFIVLTSVLLQGPAIPIVARSLGLDEPADPKPRYPIELEQTADLDSDLVEVPVPPGSPVVGRKIVDLALPDEALVILISRDGRFIVPRGGTALRERDRLLTLADDASLHAMRRVVEGHA